MNRFIIRNRDIKIVKAKDFDWAAFGKGKIAIAVDNEDPKELDEVLSILDKKECS